MGFVFQVLDDLITLFLYDIQFFNQVGFTDILMVIDNRNIPVKRCVKGEILLLQRNCYIPDKWYRQNNRQTVQKYRVRSF